MEATYLLSTRLAAFRWHELYLGLFTELGNLYIDDRLQKKATAKGLPSVLLRGRWQLKGNAQSRLGGRGRIPKQYTGAD